MLLVKNMRCSEVHCQKVINSIISSCKIQEESKSGYEAEEESDSRATYSSAYIYIHIYKSIHIHIYI